MDGSELAFIIPALNEEATIKKIIDSVKPFGIAIVIDDGSFDHTAEIARINGAEVVIHNQNLGYDQALASGFKKSRELNCRFAITIDADGQHDVSIVPEVLDHLRSGVDIVFGRRVKTQRFGEYIFGKIWFFLYGVSDPLCGLKGYNMGFFSKKNPVSTYNSIGTEIALFALRTGKNFKEVYVPIHLRVDEPRFSSGLKANIKILNAAIIGICKKL